MTIGPEYTHCSRCRRPAPDQESPEFIHWEATADGLPVCPGCLAGLDSAYMDESAMEALDAANGEQA